MSESEAVARDEFFESLLGDFLDESGQLLDRLNENLLQLDDWVRSLDENHTERCDEDLMNDMFRSAHSLKGLSAMLGLADINDLTHKVENVFDAARKDELIISGDCVELMFQAVDRLVAMVDVLKVPDGEPVSCEQVLQGISNLLQKAGVERKKSSQADAEKALADLTSEEAGSASPSVCEVESPESLPQQAEQTQQVEQVEQPEPGGQVERREQAEQAIELPGQVPIADPFADIENEAEISTKYLGIFIDETDLALDSLTETLLALEGGGDRESIATLLVTSHRIKGSAASIGLNRAAKLAHLMEDQLQHLSDTNGSLSPELTDAMLRATDGLRSFLGDLKNGSIGEDNFSMLASGLLAAQDANSSQAAATGPPAVPTPDVCGEPPSDVTPAAPLEVDDDLRNKARRNAPDGSRGFVGRVRFQQNLPLVGLKAQLIHEKLANLGRICCFIPDPATLDDLDTIDVVEFGVVTEQNAQYVHQQLRIGGVEEIVCEPMSPTTKPEIAQESPLSPSSPAGAKPSVPAARRPARPEPAARSDEAGETPTRRTTAAVQRKERAPEANSGNRPTETLRVDIDRLDQLMNLAGQLVISRARFTQIGERLKTSVSGKHSAQVMNSIVAALNKIASGASDSSVERAQLQAELDAVRGQARRIQMDLESVCRDVEALQQIRGNVNELGEAIHQLGRVSDGIQQSVMDTRMVPIGPLFTRFKRVVRDITRSNGKSVRLVISGEKTELDKRMIDELGDPLIHMVRNSVDHGVELPGEREAKGKPREGTVTLDAFHRGNSIYIQVTDDGKGLDPDKILRKALDKGIVAEADAEKMTPHQIYQLIWEPGLSTADKVTEVSGRGMGMDIVKSKIEDINGTVDLASTPGQGTTLTIKLPLTLAILPSLMVEVEGDVFAMPMESVVEIVRVGRKDLTTVQGFWTARVRGRVISMVRLDEVLSWNRAPSSNSFDEETTLVIVGEAGQEIGLAVDRVLGEEDVVIKSMAENYRNVAGIAGASILGDGRVSLILDAAALIDMSSHQAVSN
ncbi:MAG: chemotaxis protein CheA [Planctomycetaceae bacterium]|nr:chemotaxis protein CheA [Planctomycetaceae bacterium]